MPSKNCPLLAFPSRSPVRPSAENDPGITLVFNRSMRNFDTATNANLPTVSIATGEGHPVPGHFRWIGTHGLLFEPQGSLPDGATFPPTPVTSVD